MASQLYASGLKRLLDVGLDGIAPRLLLLNNPGSPYAYDEGHDFVNDVAAYEVAHASYARKQGGGVDFSLSSQIDLANNRVELVFAGPTLVWPNLAAGFTLDWMILYDHLGANDAANPLLCALDIDPAVPTNGQNFTVTFDAGDGNIRVSYA